MDCFVSRINRKEIIVVYWIARGTRRQISN